MSILWKATLGPNELDSAAAAVFGHLAGTKERFCLWLQGPLGAGKTTLTGRILRRLGLPEIVPVTSPTYTYLNDYQIGGRWYAHLDLYRGDKAPSAEELGLADAREFQGVFVEWPPQKAGGGTDDPYLAPTHVLEIAFADAGAARSYTLRSPG
jgi:tRNA threonylcarbamoyladenosine biosynthesis protein TsaE